METGTGKTEKKKNMIALLSIVLAAVGLAAGLLLKSVIPGAFGPGAVITFAAFLASLASVHERGSNALPMTAFWFSFLSMCFSVFYGGF